MDTSALKSFAQDSRRYLLDVVANKIDYYLSTDNVEVRAKSRLVDDLKNDIASTSKEQVIEKVAYTWFNRFCALRYMDVKQYSLIGVLSPTSAAHSQPEILVEAKAGHIKEELSNETDRDHVINLLSGKALSKDPQAEAYRRLVIMTCNYYHSIMPFLFEKIDDYTELLMPDDLLSESSIVFKVRHALDEENCNNVEVIGWLYQFYISEKKDEVINRRSVVKKEEIPAATQIFTPSWIVKYLVENSLGALWMLNRPSSNLVSKMEYFIKPESEVTDFLKIKGPEEIKICDPACGSGHMLVYAFDLLFSMYEEDGVDPKEIPSAILKNNLFGIEIDKRAGELAAFALTMKAREKQRRYFSSAVQPMICVLENVSIHDQEIEDYIDNVGRDLFSVQLQNTLRQFEQAENFGSLIIPEVSDVDTVLKSLENSSISGQLFFSNTHQKVLKILKQSVYLKSRYHVLIANPPYMGGKALNPELKLFLLNNFKDTKSDIFASFVARSFNLTMKSGYIAFLTPYVWMFISSYEKLREKILKEKTVTTLVQLEYNSFAPACIPVCAFTIRNCAKANSEGIYIKLSDFRGAELQPIKTLEAISNTLSPWRYTVKSSVFQLLPGIPLVYWLDSSYVGAFAKSDPLSDHGNAVVGLQTGENGRFVRFWFEVNRDAIAFNKSSADEMTSSQRWVPYNKGGDFLKWYGNQLNVVLWENNGNEIKNFKDEKGKLRSRPQNVDLFFKESISWSKISSSSPAFRYYPKGFIFDVAGTSIFPNSKDDYNLILGFCNSSVTISILKAISPTLNFEVGHISSLPIMYTELKKRDFKHVAKLIDVAKQQWDSSEISMDFKYNALLEFIEFKSIRISVEKLSQKIRDSKLEIKRLERINDEILANIYEIKINLEENDAAELKINIREIIIDFISYIVGVVFGRFDYVNSSYMVKKQPSQSAKFEEKGMFNSMLDKDNVVPFVGGGWFSDDVTTMVKKTVNELFGPELHNENIDFIESILGSTLDKYLLKDFYADHIRRYKNRPIYWMFSSPKNTFNALIYLHRYNSDTVSTVLNGYLREFRTKLSIKKENLERLSASGDSSSRDKTAALNEIEQLKKTIVELDEYENDILYPLATQRLEIDLDDGVKVNYQKFGKALKPIKGLDKDEE
ncbi:MAG: BREX-1 system adenine-specific DNA-methyltransferase PglX [Moraxellaceae bacterium]|nr:BREX-1 system adenine-specific DNA-methyltransferase PglX [Pseudobdellovibrionaceae bacterium]